MRRDSTPWRKKIIGLSAIMACGFALADIEAQVMRSSQTSTYGANGSTERSVFGSPFVNQPFSISGMTGGPNRFASAGYRGSMPPGGGGRPGGGNGGLGIVAPGWWGVGWGPGFGLWGPGFGGYPSAWWVGGWNTGFVANDFWGPGWGWDPWLWNGPGWNQGFVWDWGFLGAMDNVVQQGNARFGPARPVRQQRAAARRQGIAVPGGQNAGGLNAVPPMRPLADLPAPAMPLVLRMRANDDAPAVAPKPAVIDTPDRFQTADRLARNGLFDDAVNRYRTLAEATPEDPAPWVRIAQVHALANRPEAAVKSLARAEEIAPDRLTSVLKTHSWSSIADAVSIDRLRAKCDEWGSDPALTGIEKLKATLSASETPVVARTP